ncbi:MAG TPA: polyprenyl synthetase family protein [Cytophagaceae bacterium]
MHSVKSLADRLSKEVSLIDLSQENPRELYEPISYIMNLGGKRVRPLLTLLAAQLFTEKLDSFYKPALAIELFHNFSLIHDDIMDKAPIRRGKPTVHEKWNNNTAILSGDVMLVKVYDYLLALDDSLLRKAMMAFNKCAANVCEGQQLDVNFETEDGITEEQYLEMIKLKTAVLLGFSLEFGGMLAMTTQANQDLLRSVGINIGVGFQLKDDLLDAFGDQEKFGKKPGGDIIAKKKTFLLIKAFENAKGDDLKKLTALMQQPNESTVKEVTALYEKLGVKKAAEEKVNYYFNEGFKALNKINAPLYKKKMLKSFLEQLINREN